MSEGKRGTEQLLVSSAVSAGGVLRAHADTSSRGSRCEKPSSSYRLLICRDLGNSLIHLKLDK